MIRSRIKLQKKPFQVGKYLHKGMLPWVSVGILIVIQIFFAIQTSTFGAELSSLEYQQSEIKKQTEELKSSLVEKSSLTTTDYKAESLGFMSPKHVVFLEYDNAVASLR